MKRPLIVCDDPVANSDYDLARILRRGPWELIARIEPLPGAAAPVSADPAAAGGAGMASPPESMRYRILPPASKNGATPRTFDAGSAASTLLELAKQPFVVVAFVSFDTVPLLRALQGDERTRPFLRVGVSGIRLDTNYNLAQTLHSVDHAIHYHEHTQLLDRVLPKRLEGMLREQAAGLIIGAGS